ncbi:MAG TPA: YoaK family protein [Xanthobacteraceae bacterium]|jgi:uncharacterized membrane protein YoaK (UPF0700 family)
MAEQQQLTSPQARTASFLLSFAAGYVDSCTFIALFGLFVAQVTGSFVTVGAQIARGEHAFILPTFGIPIFLVAGAATTLLVAFAEERRLSALPCCLVLECALLAGFLVAGIAGAPFAARGAPLEIAAGVLGLSAMGVQSAMVQLVMRGTPSTNVMTTNTTQLSILATQTLLYWRLRRSTPFDPRAARLASTRDRLGNVLCVAVGFLIGTVAGGLAYGVVDMWCLLLPIAVIFSFFIWSLRSPRFAA